MQYDWYKHGVWISDSHDRNLGMDVHREPRVPTGETVVLQPPRLGFTEVPALTGEIYKLEKYELYIAIGHYKGVTVLFYDKTSFSRLHKELYPDEELSCEEQQLKPGNPDECPGNVYEWGICDDCEYYQQCANKE